MRFTYNKAINRPRKSGWKRTLGRYYNLAKTTFWQQKHYRLLSRSINSELLEHEIFFHQTVLMRNLTGLNRELQKNKLINLKLSLPWFNGLILRPGEIFSFWFILGQTTYQRGFVDGMVLCNGEIVAEVGGGLCQLSNLIYWMTLHTPLTVIERWRHGFDVFPDIDRTQPFGSGATIAYPGIDLKIKNNTRFTFQLKLNLTSTYLQGQWRSEHAIPFYYKVYELDHRFIPNPWGGYLRHNKIYRDIFSKKSAKLLATEFITENTSRLRYDPLISD